MKPFETKSNGQHGEETASAPNVAGFEKVFNRRHERIRGLWQRGGVFYARFSATDQAGRKRDVFRALEGIVTVAQATESLRKLKDDAAERAIPVEGRSPTFKEYAERYLLEVSAHKAPATAAKERTQIAWWSERVGSLTLRQIHRVHIDSSVEEMRKEKQSPRTINLYLGSLRGVFKRALNQGLIRDLPMHGMRDLKVTMRQRELVPLNAFLRVLAAAPAATKNAVEFTDYFRFLLYSGAREKETLRLRWSNVDFAEGQVVIGSDGLSKNHEARHVDFNPQLKDLLREMEGRRAPDSQWLFPSPQRGDKDIHAKTFRESLRLCCAAAATDLSGFHSTRHFFISTCVMAGVDFMTIARWVGHKDGGVLIGRVYGHIGDQHRKQQAMRLNFKQPEDNVIRMTNLDAVA